MIVNRDVDPIFVGQFVEQLKCILRRLGDGRSRRALDVGAADGFLAELLTRQGWQVTALERDPAQAAKARGRCHDVIIADLDEAAPRLEGVFDAIVYGDVLEHLADPLPVLVALNRSLAPGGRVIVSVPNVAHLWVRLSLLLGRWEYADRGILDRTHVRFFTRRSFARLLGDAGLDLEELVAEDEDGSGRNIKTAYVQGRSPTTRRRRA